MAEDPPTMTLQQRIASLNAAHIGRIPGEPSSPYSKPKPQVPTRRPIIVKQNSINIPQEHVTGSVLDTCIGNQPNAPPGQQSRKAPPPLPSRKRLPDQQRRESTTSNTDSNETRLVATRTRSNENRLKAPAWGECEIPIPSAVSQSVSIPDRPKYNNRAPSSITSVSVASSDGSTSRRSSVAPPPLPTRKASNPQVEQTVDRRTPPVPSMSSLNQARQSSFSRGIVAEVDDVPVPALPSRPVTKSTQSHPQRVFSDTSKEGEYGVPPPPVPLASRPHLNASQDINPETAIVSSVNGANAGITSVCMVCRDFSAPDHHASLFPRQQVTSLQVLGQQLTAPFQSLTDKARAIFTWLHYNVDYNVEAFFNNTVKGSTPQSTLQTGLAVCEGYAALFANLATYAGLEAVVISGHGKGYGFTNLVPGSLLPPYSPGHAWNAVKIDNHEWKLIDPCWGAGHVKGAGMPYCRQFSPEMFTMSNEEFGIKHFPGNKDHFFLPGGRTMSWEDYIQVNPDQWPYQCEAPTIFDNAKKDYTIGSLTILPYHRKITVRSNEMVRFQFSLFCPHWTLDRHTRKGLPPVFILAIGGVDGRKKDHVPLEYVKGMNPGGGGDLWYVDVPARELGAQGQTLTLFAITSFADRQDARGLTVREFNEKKGRVGMGFVGIAAWELI